MKRNQSTLLKITLGATTALCVLLSGASHAAVDANGNIPIATSPLFLSYSAEPNIMFIQDDSGSMHWEFMPDSFRRSDFVIPRGNDVYASGNNYGNDVPAFSDAFGYSVGMRSPDTNRIYYNPEVTYTPWAKSDGTLYPDADPDEAYYNIENTAAGKVDLTTDISMTANWDECDAPGVNCTRTTESRTFYPAVYYRHDGVGATWDTASYTEFVIKDDAAAIYDTDGGLTDRSTRTDCVSGVCNGVQEMQNFANWFTYYRSRILLSRAGVGRAFSEQGTNVRVGFGAINKGSSSVDGANIDTIIDGVRKFEGGDREDWFERLYEHPIPTSGTPLRTSLKDAGTYYSRQGNSRTPWDATPEDGGDATNEISCRQSYTILMSDGYWNGGDPGVGNVDNTNGSSIFNPSGVDYSYTAETPYKDAHSNTLADVAMYYWNRDLNTVLDNKVPQNPLDEAYWQHMVTFTVGLGVIGSLDYTDPAVLQDIIDDNTQWPNPPDSDPYKIDDMWHAAINGRGDFFSAADPNEFANALSATLTNIADRTGSAAAVATNSTRISSETRIYQARFNSRNWTGELYAYPIDKDGSVLFNDPGVWEAGAVLDARSNPVSTRKIFTTKGSGATVAFDWSNLDDADKVRIDKTYDTVSPDETLGTALVDFLLGDQSNEGSNGGAFRNRDSLLGDIINSDPLYVGIANYAYTVLPEGGTDTDTNGVLDYNDYLIAQEAKNSGTGRTPVLYVGGNSGMLHAFNAENGNEMFGYVPNAVYDNLADLADPSYNHKFYVDGSPKANDAFLANTWKTVLVASTGSGGNSVFALDVTDPGTDASVTFDTNDVLWEIVGDPASADVNLKELGTTIGQPTIVRLEEPYTTPSGTNPGWYAVFGNGYNSATGTARLFVVELETGNIAKVIDTEAGPVNTGDMKNGLATLSPIDINGDRITDSIYAGDLYGNMWRFDMTGTSAGGDLVWDVAYTVKISGTDYKAPLFTATDTANGNPQPITIRPQVGRNPEGGTMVYFGTGKYLENEDNIVPNTPQIQSFYGIKDDYSKNGKPVDKGDLLEQTIDYEQSGQAVDYRLTSENAMGNNDDGWYLDLAPPPDNDAGIGERVIANPVLRYDRIIFTTAIPSSDPCDYGGSGWLMELSALYGSRLSYAVIDVNGDGLINDLDVINDGNDDYFVSGKRLDGIGEPGAIIGAGDKEYKYISTSTGTINVTTEAGGGSQFARQSWRRLQ
jgi:type IV pilus assembly protein PilY1